MEPNYDHIRKRARRIVSHYPLPGFYRHFPQATYRSRQHFRSDKSIAALRRQVAGGIKSDFGHGLKHSIKVALDVGALILIEGGRAGSPEPLIRKQMTLGQCAALLHDIEREQNDHAEKGASAAKKILPSYPLSPEDVSDICLAIRNHEAFQRTLPIRTPQARILSDCLYDADKFRWGPDNFTDTLWRMVTFSRMPISDFIRQYPKGLDGLSRIRDTFRTHTGRIYGPEFIDLGLAIGKELYEIILAEFAS